MIELNMDEIDPKKDARDRANAARRARRAANPEKAAADRERQRLRDLATPGRLEARRARNAAYMRERSEVTKEQRKIYNAENSARAVARVAAWRLQNPGRFAAQRQNSRARSLGVAGSLSPTIVDQLLERQEGLCACCGEPLRGAYEVDHVLPFSRGGLNVDENVQLLTQRCNLQKGSKTMAEFIAWKMKNHK